MSDNETNRLVKGALVLTLAGLISKLLSAGYRIPLQNLTGDIGFYVYQQIYPILGIVFVLTLYGFPSAISKMAVELKAQGTPLSIRGFYIPVFLILFVLSTILFLFLYFNAPYIAGWVGDSHLTSTYQFAAFACLLVPFSSFIRGVFQGEYMMKPTALSQVVEQFVRVTIIILAALFIFKEGDHIYQVGRAAVLASILGAIASSIILIVLFMQKKPYAKQQNEEIQWQYYIRTIFILGIAAALNHMILLILQFADTFTLFPSLIEAGYSKEAAMEAKGVFDRGQPLIQFGTVLGSSFALALLPSISLKKIKQEPNTYYPYIGGAMLVSIYLALGATIGLVAIFPEVNRLLFQDNQGTLELQLLVVSIILSSIAITASSILQALGFIKRIALFILLAFFVKWIANQVLVVQLGLMGSAVATILSLLLLSCIVLIELQRKLPMLHLWQMLRWKALIFPGIIMVIYLSIVEWITLPWLDNSRISLFIYVVFISLSGALLYGYMLIKCQAFTEKQLRMLPFNQFFKMK
ncbi:putative polysaccharide biosynthesis protein [Virgibacillus salexigens]|nr:polysaccharide biosynthesis protein [Virgibacillus kapii]